MPHALQPLLESGILRTTSEAVGRKPGGRGGHGDKGGIEGAVAAAP